MMIVQRRVTLRMLREMSAATVISTWVMSQFLKSRMWISIHLVLHWLQWWTQKRLSRTQHLHSDNSHTEKLYWFRCFSFHKKNKHSISSISSSCCQIFLLLTQDKQACKLNNRGQKDMRFNLSVNKEKKDQWDNKEREVPSVMLDWSCSTVRGVHYGHSMHSGL